jgi:hypothetical protein
MKKVNLIRVIKAINLILFFFLLQDCKAQDLRNDSPLVFLNIQFGEHYNNDKVDLAINDSLILKKAILKTNRLYGLTNVWVKVIKKEEKCFISTSESKIVNLIRLNSDKVEIKLRYHRKQKKFDIKIPDGKYLVFDTDQYGEIMCTQTVRRPFFD